MPKAARTGDTCSGHGCFPATPVTSGSPDISINGHPAARKGDTVLSHGCPCPQMPHGIHGRVITEGSSLVSFNGHPAARLGDAVDCGGEVAEGSGDVLIGDTPWRSPSHQCIALAAKEGAPLLRISPMPAEPPPRPVTAKIRIRPASPKQQAKQRIKRYQCRNKLADLAENVPELQQSGQRLRLNNDSILYAEAADAVYDMDEYYRSDRKLPYPSLPVGLHEVDISQIPDLKRDDLLSKRSGFGASLFYSEINDKYILAYRGTRITSLKDWNANFTQALWGESEQYDQAIYLARKLRKTCTAYPDLMGGKFCSTLKLTGHSLGGGMIAAAALAARFLGLTFNASGLHKNTLARAGGKTLAETDPGVTNYTVNGEVLTATQQNWPLPEAVGKQHTLPNTADGLPGMQPVISAIHSANEYITELIIVPLKYLTEATSSTPLKPLAEGAEAAGKHIAKMVSDYSFFGVPSVISMPDNIIKSVKGHFMQTVINGIEQQKQEDIQHITRALQEGTCGT